MAKLRVLAEKPPVARGTPDNQLRELRDYLYRVNEELEYLLTHLDEDNMSMIMAARLNGYQDKIMANGILVGAGGGSVRAAVAGQDYATMEQLDEKANQTQLADVESGDTASRAYAAGEYFCWAGLLYRAKTAIAQGAAFTDGTNCEPKTVGEALKMTVYKGTTEGAYGTNTVPGTSYTIINTLPNLPAGKYLVVGSASNGTNVSGTLALTITNATAGTNLVTNRTETNGGGGNTVCAIAELSAASTIRLRATQNTGSSLTLNTNSLTAIKLA